ncbi:MAG: helix-turn-helix domain-containing protein [Muribaculaceae bacterium]|nr:helix-turn-helix domain-containing protein [Roseburia sp.]MCM1431144.1 helix-turn-helix domain-containing protein [Muribaculaceae bacterium]MCM1492567.1 helix-turn-helix domain-containing protein [Muribaculaceae bacterium]
MNRRPEYDAKQTGRNLRRLRLENGYTAEQVREYIGVGSVQAIYKWERGAGFPTLDNFFALVELYHAKPMEVLAKYPGDMPLCLEWESCVKPPLRHIEQYWIQIQNRNRE